MSLPASTRPFVNSLVRWPRAAPHDTKELICRVVAEQDAPVHSRRLFDLLLAEAGPRAKPKKRTLIPGVAGLKDPRASPAKTTPDPPYPDLPVRSLTFLKTSILPSLAATGVLRKVHVSRKLTPSEIDERLRASTTTQKGSREKRAAALERLEIHEWGWVPGPRSPQAEAAAAALAEADDAENALVTAEESALLRAMEAALHAQTASTETVVDELVVIDSATYRRQEELGTLRKRVDDNFTMSPRAMRAAAKRMARLQKELDEDAWARQVAEVRARAIGAAKEQFEAQARAEEETAEAREATA